MPSPDNSTILNHKKKDPAPPSIIGFITKICETVNKVEVDWKVPKFFETACLDKSWTARCPVFTWLNTRWQLEITHTSGNELRMFLYKSKAPDRLPLAFKFGLRLKDGAFEMRSYHTKNFNSKPGQWGTFELILESELLKRKDVLMPAGNLTLSLSMVLLDIVTQPKKRKYEHPDVLSSDLLALFKSGKNSDITVVVGEQKYPVHKSILAARSDVFAAMFQHNMKEVDSSIITVTDCEPSPFKDFLLYLYSGKVENFSLDNVFHLYKISDKYNVQGLINLCVDYFIPNLSASNFFDVAILANQFNDIKLLSATQNFFMWNSLEITELDEWEHFMKENFPTANKYLRRALKDLKTVKYKENICC